MSRKLVSSGSPYEGSIGFSRAVRIGNTIAVSGTAPIAADGTTAAPGNMHGQAKRCLEIIEKAITDAGGTLENVIRTRMYLTDAARWEEAGKAHGEFFGEIRPASTMVVVKELLSAEWLVEMEADCLIEE